MMTVLGWIIAFLAAWFFYRMCERDHKENQKWLEDYQERGRQADLVLAELGKDIVGAVNIIEAEERDESYKDLPPLNEDEKNRLLGEIRRVACG